MAVPGLQIYSIVNENNASEIDAILECWDDTFNVFLVHALLVA